MALDFSNPHPYIVEDPVEIHSFAQVHANIIDDAVTRGIFAYNTGSPAYALQHYGEGLKFMIAQKNWRRQDAADLLAFLQRQMLAKQGLQVQNTVNDISNLVMILLPLR